MDTGAVIVAAGMSSRMGSFKPMLQLGGDSMVRRVIAALYEAGVSPILLVTGHEAAALETHVADLGVVCLRNPRYAATSMFDSAAIGLSYIRTRCARTFFTPVDVPLFSPATLRALMASPAAIAKPVCCGAEGHPILLSCDLIPAILQDGGAGGLRGALSRCGAPIALIPVEDEGILLDADTPEAFAALAARCAANTGEEKS